MGKDFIEVRKQSAGDSGMTYLKRPDGEYVVQLSVDGQNFSGYAYELPEAIRDLADAMEESSAETKGND
jgi:hypothetical protein